MEASEDCIARREPESIEARYANYFEVGHNAYEFLLDFGQYQPNTQRVQMQTRMITGPVFAKLFSSLLSRAIAQFEQEHGFIDATADDLDPLELVRLSINGFERRIDPAAAHPKTPKET